MLKGEIKKKIKKNSIKRKKIWKMELKKKGPNQASHP